MKVQEPSEPGAEADTQCKPDRSPDRARDRNAGREQTIGHP